MGTQLALTVGFGCLLGLVVLLSSKHASKAAQLESLKAELKKRAEEQERAKQLIDRAYHLPAADVRKRLQDISGK